jgi:CRP/FNR family transcriptional regulator
VRPRSLRKGEYLFRMGDPLRSLSVVRGGCVMTRLTTATGATHVLDFHPSGQLVGVDAINDRRHPSDAIALDAVQVCELPYASLLGLAAEEPVLQHRLMQMFSRQIARNEAMLLQLGKFTIEERLAAWLLEFAGQSSGLSGIRMRPGTFLLPMTRQDLGDHLGTTIESISRLLTRFRRDHLIEVHGRQLRIVAHELLRQRAQSALDGLRGD